MRLIRYTADDFTQNLRGNLFGGLTAAIVALPLALAFGISSGIGPVAGLYGAIVVGLFASVFGGTRPQISGPTGPMTVVMTAMTAQFISQYPDNGLALAFSVVFLGGMIQALIGMLRLGKYIIMVPYPVISGFMTGIGIIIIVLQVGPLLGHDSAGSVVSAFQGLPKALFTPNMVSSLLGGACLLLLFLWRGRANQLLPSPLLVLVLATLVLQFLPNDLSPATIGAIPSSLPEWHWPVFKWELAQDMLVNAIMLAVLGSIDSLLTSLVSDNLTGEAHDSDRELVGQGVANAFAGLVGGLPGAGATMRTVVNVKAGGDGPLSGVVHASILLSAVLGLGALFENIPLTALSAVLIKVGVDIVDWPFLARIRNLPRFTVGLMLVVLLLTVFVDLITAVFVGVFLKNLMLLDRLSNIELGRVMVATSELENSELNEEEVRQLKYLGEGAVLLRITGPLSYAVSRGLVQRFNSMKPGQILLIDLSSASIIGVTTLLAIERLIKTALASGTEVRLIDEEEKHRKSFQKLNFIELVGKENFYKNFTGATAL